MNPIVTSGYVLHRRPYRETSAIVDVLTHDFGRMSFVAKGMQRNKNPNKGLLQPMQLLRLDMVCKNTLKTLRTVEPDGPLFKLQGRALYSLFYVNELLVRVLTDEMAIDGLFLSYHQLLQHLDNGHQIEPLLRQFELQLLEQLGYGVDYQHDCMGNEIVDDACFYQFIPDNGFMPLGKDVARANYTFEGRHLVAMSQGRWDAQALRAAKRLTRLAMHPLLGDKPLNSRKLFLNLE